MSSIIHFLVAFILVGCGTKNGDVQDIQVESGTQPVPPQPVIGSYLAAAFETPDTVNRNACSFSFHEGKDVFTSALTAQPYQLVPIANLKELSTIHIECLGSDSSQVFSASLSLNSSALEQMSSLLVNEPNEPIQFVARFFANGDVNNQSANHEVLSMEKLVVSEIDDKADKSEVSSGSNDDNTTKNSNPPQVLGVKIMDHPTDSKLRILHVIVIDRNLAVEPYSFDGGKVWTKQSSVEVDRRIWFDKSLIKVRDAAGNQTQLQGKIYTYN